MITILSEACPIHKKMKSIPFRYKFFQFGQHTEQLHIHSIHRKRYPESSKVLGFTLIEMAIVIFITGIVISTILTVLPSILKTAKAKETRALLKKYDYALQGYAIANFRLPFADSNNDGLEDNNSFLGTLPYKTLGLSSGDDAWGRPVKYAVYGKLGGSNNLTEHFASKAAFQNALNAASATSDTAIAHTINSGGSCGDITPNQAYIIVSGGVKDLDGVNGFFDLCNGTANNVRPAFNPDNQTQSTNYDDLVRSNATTVLSAEIH